MEDIDQNPEIPKQYDAVLFSGVLHHLEDIDLVLQATKSLLGKDGIVLGHEPCHEGWQPKDANTVALIRGLLALTGKWYEPLNAFLPSMDSESMSALVSDIKTEYVEERDKSEGGQSPHDNTFNGEEILCHFHCIGFD